MKTDLSPEKTSLFREPEYSYCFHVAEQVDLYVDNTYDQHKFYQGELCSFEHEWERENGEIIFE